MSTLRRAAPLALTPERLLLVTGIVFEAVLMVLVWRPLSIWSRPVSPHANVVEVFGVDRAGALRYALTVAVLFALYGAALGLVLVRGARPGRALMLGLPAVFCATLVLTHPLSSTDVFNYIAGARLQWVHGANPLVTPPLARPDDPFVQLVTNWRDLPSPYGPLWSLVTGAPLALGGGDPALTVVAFKALAALCLLAAGALAAATAERLRPGTGAMALVVLCWNPWAIWHVAGNGHNDAVMACLLALACLLLVHDRPGPALIALTASALVKFATALLLPAIIVWWWRAGRQPALSALAPWIGVAALITVAAYAPYWHGTDTFRTVLNEGNYFTVSGPAVLRGGLLRLTDPRTADALAIWLSRLQFLGLYLALLWAMRPRSRGVESLLVCGALALLAYVLVAATYFAPWYLVWPVTLAATVPWRRDVVAPALVATLGSMSVLLWATWARARLAPDPLADWYPMHVLSFWSIGPPALAAWLWARRRLNDNRLDGSADHDPPVLEGKIAGAGPNA